MRDKLKPVYVLLGEFEFLRGDVIIHSVGSIAEVLEADLENYCEDVLGLYDGYLIPEMFNGKIIMNG